MGSLSQQEYKELTSRYLKLSAMLEIPGAIGSFSVTESPLEDFIEIEERLLIPKDVPLILNKHEQPIHSWNRNAFNIMACQFLGINSTDDVVFGDAHINIKDQGGDLRGSSSYALSWGGHLGHGGGMNDDERGIIVGTGDTEEAFDDYVMDSKISDGSGAGELFYFAQFKPTVIWNSDDRTWTITHERYFKNNDGSSITINEVGIAEYIYATTLQYYILTLRDALSSGIAIASGKVARVAIEFETTAWPS